MMRSMLLMSCIFSVCAEQGNGARDWELQNSALHLADAINTAELGMANLKEAMNDQSLLSDVARELRQPEGRAELFKMMADPSFQEQMQALIEENGAPADFLTLEFYGALAKQDNSPPESLASLLLALNPAPARKASARRNVRMDALEDLKQTAVGLNPSIGYWDPLKFSKASFWGQGNDATIGWLRHSEIKHGRVAMAGFVGFCIHENGIRWPWALSTSLPDYSSFEGLSAPAVWDAIPTASKLQILLVIGFFEFWSESRFILESDGQKHYMRGGKPGYFPTFDQLPHPVPFNLYDPFGFAKKMSEEKKADRLLAEINNGRLAMLGLMSLVAEARAGPGAVPALTGLIKEYEGQPMAPFSETDKDLGLVKGMLYIDKLGTPAWAAHGADRFAWLNGFTV